MEILFLIIILVFSVIIHEISHGAMADYLGDPTAKQAGRLTLNPLKHLDPIGSILIPVFLVALNSPILFGWAKPVPINPYNFRDQKYGAAKVAIAGPAANFFIALFFGLLIRFFPKISESTGLYLMFGNIIFLNLLLAIFNLLPVPPLDGSHILFTFLPYSITQRIKKFFSKYSLFILPLSIFIILLLFNFIVSIIGWISQLIIGGSAPFF